MKRTKDYVYKGHTYKLVDTPVKPGKYNFCNLCAFKDLTDPCASSPGCGKNQHYEKVKK
jgi:hypothetical protein